MKSLYEEALEYIEAGDYDEAESALLKYLSDNPTDAMAYNKLGVAFAKRKNRQKAKHCFEMALKCDVQLVNAINNLGNIAREEGNLELALDYYQKAIHIDPTNALPHNNLSVVYKQLHRYGEFVREIKTAKRLENRKNLSPEGNATFITWLKEIWSKLHR